MDTLPADTVFYSDVSFEMQPSLTWKIDKAIKRIQGNSDGYQSVKQAVEIILNVERFRWQIFSPYSGILWSDLIGMDAGYVAAKLQNRIRSALMMDDRIKGVSEFQYKMNGSNMIASMVVKTVYGDVSYNMEVDLS